MKRGSLIGDKEDTLILRFFVDTMTKNETTIKQFDAVQYMRQQRDKLSDELAEMSKAEIIAYFKRRKVESKVKPCA